MFALMTGLVINIQPPVNAASNGITFLKSGKTITTVLAGSKKHKVKMVDGSKLVINSYSYTVKLYIDGKVKYSYTDPNDVKKTFVCLLKVSSSTTLIMVYCLGENYGDRNYEYKIFRYYNGVLKQCAGSKLVSENCYYPIPLIAGDNLFALEALNEAKSIGEYILLAIYKYDPIGKKISMATSAFNIAFYESDYSQPGGKGGWSDNWGTARTSFETYTYAGGKTLSFTAQQGDRLRVQRVSYIKKAQYFEVMNKSGMTGWYKDPTGDISYFFETEYSGGFTSANNNSR
jgi:hypothetical protein